MTGDGEATAYIHDRWCFAGWQVMVLGTGGERPKDVLLGRGAYLRRARTSLVYTEGGVGLFLHIHPVFRLHHMLLFLYLLIF